MLIGPRLYRLHHVHLLLRQERSIVEGPGRQYRDHWRWLLHFCSDSYDHSRIAAQSTHEKEQRFLPNHNEPAGDAFPVQLTVYRRCAIE